MGFAVVRLAAPLVAFAAPDLAADSGFELVCGFAGGNPGVEAAAIDQAAAPVLAAGCAVNGPLEADQDQGSADGGSSLDLGVAARPMAEVGVVSLVAGWVRGTWVWELCRAEVWHS